MIFRQISFLFFIYKLGLCFILSENLKKANFYTEIYKQILNLTEIYKQILNLTEIYKQILNLTETYKQILNPYFIAQNLTNH